MYSAVENPTQNHNRLLQEAGSRNATSAPLRKPHTMTTMTTIGALTSQLTASMKKPGARTLTLIDKALSYLTPFESAKASAVSQYEKRELLELLNTHRPLLTPYLDADRIESNLRRV